MFNALRFLLVEEDTSYRLLLSSLLRMNGVETAEASTLSAALMRLSERPVDWVLIGATPGDRTAALIASRITARFRPAGFKLAALTSIPATLFVERCGTEPFDTVHERVFEAEAAKALIASLQRFAPDVP